MKEAESPALFDKALKISFSSFDVEDPFRDGFLLCRRSVTEASAGGAEMYREQSTRSMVYIYL